MSQDGSFPDSTPHVPARKAAATAPVMERLEYRMPGRTAENPQPVAPSNGSSSLIDEWLRPPAPERTVQDATVPSAKATGIAEETWQKERASLEARLAEQMDIAAQAVTVAGEAGRREGLQAAEAQLEEERQRQQIVDALEDFRQERARYFHSMEREVVRLALAIAARVLHRQAQMDPLFLSGAVRVALDKLVDTSGVVLRIAPVQVPAWQEMFRSQAGVRMQPEILGDPSLHAGECVLETRLGTVELGVPAQLEEIEKGFFDLLHHHPDPHRPGRNANMSAVS